MKSRGWLSSRNSAMLLAISVLSFWSVVTAPPATVASTDEEIADASRADVGVDEAALTACDEFMAAFNASDMAAWRRTLNYPHVRLADGTLVVSKNPEEYEREWDFAEFARRTGWHHSRYDHKQVVQRGPDKAHVAVRFTRFRADGSKIATYDALYVVTNVNGHWGVQIRSSFAPRK